MSVPQLTPSQRVQQRHAMMRALDAGTHTVAALAALYGYSEKTIYKWRRRWREAGRTRAGLQDRSRAPHRCPRRLAAAAQATIVALAQRFPEEGLVRVTRRVRAAGLLTSVHGVYRTLLRAGVYVPRRRRRPRRRYQKVVHTVPGAQVQADLLQLGRGRYQLTVIDSASRYLDAVLLPAKDVATVTHALTRLLTRLPFPVQQLQTDHGPEFTYAFLPHVQRLHPLDRWCAAHGIHHRLTPIAYPQANGKVERVHRICRQEFYRRYPLRAGQTWTAWLPRYLAYYNTRREHGSLGWRTPAEELARLTAALPQPPAILTHV